MTKRYISVVRKDKQLIMTALSSVAKAKFKIMMPKTINAVDMMKTNKMSCPLFSLPTSAVPVRFRINGVVRKAKRLIGPAAKGTDTMRNVVPANRIWG